MSNKIKFYSFYLPTISKANPETVCPCWSPDQGVHYLIDEGLDGTEGDCWKILGTNFLLNATMVDNYGLVWDHVDLSEVFNHLVEADGVPLDILNNLAQPGRFANLNGTEFNRIPYQTREAACSKFTNNICNLDRTDIENALELSYMIAWARGHKKEIIEA